MAIATEVKVTGIDFVGYLVKDPKRAIEFYKSNLGLTPTWEQEQGAEFDLADGSTFGLWHMTDGTWHPSAGAFFAVPDLKAAVAELKRRGVKLPMGEGFEGPVCHMAAVEDSEGNIFMLHQRKTQ